MGKGPVLGGQLHPPSQCGMALVYLNFAGSLGYYLGLSVHG